MMFAFKLFRTRGDSCVLGGVVEAERLMERRPAGLAPPLSLLALRLYT